MTITNNQVQALTERDFERLHIPDGPYARKWLTQINAFLSWREERREAHRRESFYTKDFFCWWFKSRMWRGNLLDVGGAAGGMIADITTTKKILALLIVDPLLREEERPKAYSRMLRVPGVGEAMPFVADGWAHVVTAFSVMQHCIDPAQLCKEVLRVTKKGLNAHGEPAGRFCGTVCCGQISDIVLHGFPEGRYVHDVLEATGWRVIDEDTFRNGLYCFKAVPA